MDLPAPRTRVMRINIRLLSAVLAVPVAAVPAAFALAAGAPGGMTPRPALVSAHGLTVRSTVGSFCLDGRSRRGVSAGVCGDAAYPLRLRGRLPVHGGERIALRFRHNPQIRDRVGTVRVTAFGLAPDARGAPGKSPTRSVTAVQNRHHRSRWHVRLPRGIHGANVLDIAVRYSHRHGDADFWAGITTGR